MGASKLDLDDPHRAIGDGNVVGGNIGVVRLESRMLVDGARLVTVQDLLLRVWLNAEPVICCDLVNRNRVRSSLLGGVWRSTVHLSPLLVQRADHYCVAARVNRQNRTIYQRSAILSSIDGRFFASAIFFSQFL